MKSNQSIKIGIITSKGGHLTEILQLNPLFQQYNHFWVTFKGKDTSYYLKNERVYFAYFPESRNVVNFFKNLYLAYRILKQEKPDYLVSAGAGIALPFYIVGKLFFRINLIYIESFDFVAYPSLTGKLLKYSTNLLLIQHEIQKQWYPNAKLWGSLL